MTTVVIDPGHGGTRSVGGSSPNNATGPGGLKEKAVTLQVGLAARRALARSSVQVLLTRESDENVGIVSRAKIAKDASAAAFVSLHFNAAASNGLAAQGTETWIGNGHSALSRDLAARVQRSVVAVTGYRNRGVKVGNVSGVIKPENHDPETANCLVEISFLDRQPAEERRLGDPAYIQRLGDAVAAAVIEHLGERGLGRETEFAFLHEPDDAASARALNLVRDDEVEYAADATPAIRTEAAPTTPDVDRAVPVGNVPFIDPYPTAPSFTDLAGRAAVDDPANMLRGWRELRSEGPSLEAAVGRYVTIPASLLEILAARRTAVARIKAQGIDYNGVLHSDPWSGTGFLVEKNLLLTNHHVLNSREVAQTASVEFDYEVSPADLLPGFVGRVQSRKSFKVDPRRLFVTSPVVGGLDYTFVWIEADAGDAFGTVPMERASFTVEPGEQAFIVHHPLGQPKQVSVDDTDILKIQSTVIHYSSDTEYGSSGAPVFDRQGRLIALHHARQPMHVTLPDGGTADVVNEGIKISAIAIDLENRIKGGGSDAAMASAVLAGIQGSDSLSGYFGSLGRRVDPASGVEAVVDAYRGNDADVDVGFWNIEWLATNWRDAAKIKGAARVIADLNLDIWGLSEVSPPAVTALVQTLKVMFGEEYGCAFSEPDSPEGKQSTAVIWKRSILRGGEVPWPSDIEQLFHLRSDDPNVHEEAVHGKIFDRYPRAFRFALLGRSVPFDFLFIPLHLKAMAEGSLRRRLASRVLVRGIRALIAESGEADVIVGGDMNATLASGDLDAFQDIDFTPMSAEDEQAGAFSYIKSPRSLIDNIFISPNLKKTVGSADFFIVAKERSIDQFVRDISDHRPLAMRISLADRRPIESVAASSSDLDALIDRLRERQIPQAPQRMRA